jgi:hypothetical protein
MFRAMSRTLWSCRPRMTSRKRDDAGPSGQAAAGGRRRGSPSGHPSRLAKSRYPRKAPARKEPVALRKWAQLGAINVLPRYRLSELIPGRMQVRAV